MESYQAQNSPPLYQGRQVPGYIAVEGPIGVGKSSLAKRLAETFQYQPLLEKADENPFLERFYQNQPQAALSTQLFFLMQRAQQLQDLKQHDMFASQRVADFLIEKDELFAGITLDSDEMKLYSAVYRQLSIHAPNPDLVIYLQAPVHVLQDRIKQRGIPAEQHIEREYLEQLNNAYSEFFHYYERAPLLIVNASQLDLVNNEQDYQQLVDYLLSIRNGRHYFNPTIFSEPGNK